MFTPSPLSHRLCVEFPVRSSGIIPTEQLSPQPLSHPSLLRASPSEAALVSQHKDCRPRPCRPSSYLSAQPQDIFQHKSCWEAVLLTGSHPWGSQPAISLSSQMPRLIWLSVTGWLMCSCLSAANFHFTVIGGSFRAWHFPTLSRHLCCQRRSAQTRLFLSLFLCVVLPSGWGVKDPSFHTPEGDFTTLHHLDHSTLFFMKSSHTAHNMNDFQPEAFLTCKPSSSVSGRLVNLITRWHLSTTSCCLHLMQHFWHCQFIVTWRWWCCLLSHCLWRVLHGKLGQKFDQHCDTHVISQLGAHQLRWMWICKWTWIGHKCCIQHCFWWSKCWSWQLVRQRECQWMIWLIARAMPMSGVNGCQQLDSWVVGFNG